MDRIIMRDLRLAAIIGTLPEERLRPQPLIFNLTIFTDLSRPGLSDDFRDALDYSALEDAVASTVEESSCFLIEHLAQLVAERCLAFDGVTAVEVCLDKAGATRRGSSVAVVIERRRP